MGILFIRHNKGAISLSARATSEPDQNTKAVDPWLIVLIVAGSLVLATLAGTLIAHYIRARRKQGKGFTYLEKASSLSLSRKRSPDADAERRRTEDMERDMMIRKSLASRPNSASISFTLPMHGGVDDVATQSEEARLNEARPEQVQIQARDETASLREDYKAWEARVQAERGTSHLSGGGAGVGDGAGMSRHPAFATYLSVPQPTRSPSPHRGYPQPPPLA
ncbi:hypothetical protein F4808DRAFT_76455 [Astrocystis sublimbata]|nr:hypothetical protein F4808DRAFT_76455 [Astrocystis sublimbata]